MNKISRCILGVVAFTQIGLHAWAWDYAGHHTVNELALYSLPSDFPAFAKTPEAQDRIAFLAGEPDRWRNTTDNALKHINGPDHYFDLEQLADYDLTPDNLSPFRYDFVAKLATARAAHPDRFPPIDPKMDIDHTRELIGFLPWQMLETYAKLKSEFSYLKTFQTSGGTPTEIANAEANIIYTMGVMGHYFGDASQPLHTTYHHHGWVGENPHQYSTNKTIHAWIDGGFFEKTGGIFAREMTNRMHTAEALAYNGHPATPDEMFPAFMAFLLQQNKLVEPLYQMEKAGKLSGEGDVAEGKKFLQDQIIKSGQLLGSVWVSAWQQATPDTFLARDLQKRKAAAAAAAAPAK